MTKNANQLIERSMSVASPAVMERLLEPARRAELNLPIVGTSTEPEGEVHWQAPSGQWWLIGDHRSDPTAEQYGGVVVPDEVQARLTRLLREGFAPDMILVGHEMPYGYSPGDPIPSLVPAPRRQLAPVAVPQSTRALEAAATGTAVSLAVGRSAFRAIGVLAAKAAAVGSALGELDPIVIAGVRDERSGAVTWVEVARWGW